jgi:hypothetical protein
MMGSGSFDLGRHAGPRQLLGPELLFPVRDRLSWNGANAAAGRSDSGITASIEAGTTIEDGGGTPGKRARRAHVIN